MEIIKLSATDSTNTYLKELSRQITLNDGILVVADSQLSGRGQQGAQWQSEVGKSLTFSLFKKIDSLEVAHQFCISMLVSIGIIKVLEVLNIPNLSLKWPNDIMAGTKKLGGVLIENQLKGNFIEVTIVGIGLNCTNKKFESLPNAASLKMITGKNYNLDELLRKLGTSVFAQLNNNPSADFQNIKSTYESYLFRRNVVAVFENSESEKFNGIIKGVADNGNLIIENEDGRTQHYSLKQIKMML